jgi:hypothetical protein
MSGPLPFRPNDDPDQGARDEGDNEDDEEDVDEAVCSDSSPMATLLKNTGLQDGQGRRSFRDRSQQVDAHRAPIVRIEKG